MLLACRFWRVAAVSSRRRDSSPSRATAAGSRRYGGRRRQAGGSLGWALDLNDILDRWANVTYVCSDSMDVNGYPPMQTIENHAPVALADLSFVTCLERTPLGEAWKVETADGRAHFCQFLPP